MKKYFVQAAWLVPLALCLLCLPGRVQAQSVSLMIDGQSVALAQPPMMIHGRVMVPLRGVFERLGATVNYNADTHQISAVRTGANIALSLGSRVATINGKTNYLDVAPVNLDGRLLVPLRFVSEALGAQVNWTAYDRTVNILSRTGGVDILNTPTSARLISAISISPEHATVGQTVTITMTGAAGGTATTTLGNGDKLAMLETMPGKYTATYVVPRGLEGQRLDAAVNLSLPSGRTDTMTDMNALSVGGGVNLPNYAGGVLPMEVMAPNPAANVPQVFDVQGKTEPGALIRLRLLKNQNDEILSTQTIADLQGNYHFQVDTGKIGSGTHLVLQLRSEDAAGRFSDQTRLELTRQ